MTQIETVDTTNSVQEQQMNAVKFDRGENDAAKSVERADGDEEKVDCKYESEIASGSGSGSESEYEAEFEDISQIEGKGDEQMKEGREASSTICPSGATLNGTHTYEMNGHKEANKQIILKSRPLFDRLSFVAHVPYLPDAIYALTEWATKAASPQDVRYFLLEMDEKNETKSNGDKILEEEGVSGRNVQNVMDTPGPLRVILQRVILNSNSNKKQDPSIVISGCANLVTSILISPVNSHITKSVGNPINGMAHSNTMKKTLCELLRRARACASQLTLLKSNNKNASSSNVQLIPEDVADAISRSILDLLQRAYITKLHRDKPFIMTRHESSMAGLNFPSRNDDIPARICNNSELEKILREAEKEIDVLTTQLGNRQSAQTLLKNHAVKMSTIKSDGTIEPNVVNSIVNLMSRRDGAKRIATKSSAVMQVVSDCINHSEDTNATVQKEANLPASDNKNGKVEDGTKPQLSDALGLYQTEEEKKTLAQNILGLPLHTSISLCVEEVNFHESSIQKIMNETATERSKLLSRDAEISLKCREISNRVDQLKRELEELQRQESHLMKEKESIPVQLERLESNEDKEVSELKSMIAAKIYHVKLDKELRRTVDKIGDLEMVWIRSSMTSSLPLIDTTLPVTTLEVTSNTSEESSSMNRHGPSITTLFPNKLDSYLQHAHTYFQSEAICVEFLRNRVSSAESTISDLEREIQIYTSLGIVNIIEPMSQKLMIQKANVDEDNEVICAMRKDAKEMREELIQRVEEYCFLMQNNNDAVTKQNDIGIGCLKTSHVAALERISIELTAIGFYEDEDGGLGRIFSKLPNRVSITKSNAPTLVTDPSDISCEAGNSFIGDIHLSGVANLKEVKNGSFSSSIPAPVEKIAMPKLCWAEKLNNVPKKETKSLIDIQKEEMSAKERNHST